MASSEIDPLSIDKNGLNFDKNSAEMISQLEKLSTINPSEWTQKDIELIKKLQESGLPLAQRRMLGATPKILPENICVCPQKCDEKVPLKVRKYMFKYYQALRDKSKQEALILKFIEMKSLSKRLMDDSKRVQCRYKAPVTKQAIHFIFEDDSIEISDEDELNTSQPKAKKLKTSNDENLSMYQHDSINHLKSDPNIKFKVDKNGTTEVCQKAFMNVFLVPEKRVRAVREKLVASKRLDIEKKMIENQEYETTISVAKDLVAGCQPLFNMFNKTSRKSSKMAPKLPFNEDDVNFQLLNAIDNDIELVNNFFYNQLWKPEFFDQFLNKDENDKNGEKLVDGNIDISINDIILNTISNNTQNTIDNTQNTIDSTQNTFDNTQKTTDLTQNTFDNTQNTIDSTQNTFDNTQETIDTTQNTFDNTQDTNDEISINGISNFNDTDNQMEEDETEITNGHNEDELNNSNTDSMDVDPLNTIDNDDPLNSDNVGEDKNSDDNNGEALNLCTPKTNKNKNDGESIQNNQIINKILNGEYINNGNISNKNSSSSSKSRNGQLNNGSHKQNGSRQNGGHYNNGNYNGDNYSQRKSSKSNNHPLRPTNHSSKNSLYNIQQNTPSSLSSTSLIYNQLLSSMNMSNMSFDNNLKNYLNGLESSISVSSTQKNKNGGGRNRNNQRAQNSPSQREQYGGNNIHANLTTQLIQNVLGNQTAISITKTPSSASSNRNSQPHESNDNDDYIKMINLNQILNIPDSVSITPTLINK